MSTVKRESLKMTPSTRKGSPRSIPFFERKDMQAVKKALNPRPEKELPWISTIHNPIWSLMLRGIQIENPPEISMDVSSDEARESISIIPEERKNERKWKVKKAKEIARKLSEDYRTANKILKRYPETARSLVDKVTQEFDSLEGENRITAKYREKKEELLDMLRAIEFKSKEYKGTHIIPGIRNTSYENIQKLVDALEPSLSHDTEFITLLCCFLIKSSKNSNGVFEALPTGIIGNTENGVINAEEIDPIKARTVLEHIFVDLYKKSNVKDIEEATICDEINKIGFYKIKIIGLKSLLRRAFYEVPENGEKRSWLDGEDPIIRDWKEGLSRTHDPLDRNNAAQSAWLLKYGARVVNDDSTWNLDEIKSANWNSHILSSNMQGSSRESGGTISFLQAGSEELVRIGNAKKTLIGFDEDQIKPWELGQQNKWTKPVNVRGKEEYLIDLITEYIVEVKLKNERSELFDGDRLKTYEGVLWGDLYDEASLLCLSNSSLTVESALHRKYPYLFEEGIGHLVDAKHHGKFATPGGKQYLRELIAERFERAGLGQIDRSKNPPVYSFTRDELNSWCEVIYNPETRRDTKEMFADIESEMRSGSHGKNRRNTFLDFFRWDYNNETVPKVFTAKGKEFFPALMRGDGYVLVFDSDKVTKQEADLEQKARPLVEPYVCPYKNDEFHLLDVHRSPISRPNKFDISGTLAERFFKNEGAIFVNSGKRFLQAGYDHSEDFSLRRLIEAKSGRDYIVTSQELKKLLLALGNFAACVDLKDAMDAKFLRQIEGVILSPLDPRYMLIKLYESTRHNTIVNKENKYNSLRLMDELFRFAVVAGNPIFRQYAQNEEVNVYASIAWNKQEDAFKANTMFGEILRTPLFENGLKKATYYDFDEAVKEIAKRDKFHLSHEIKAMTLFLLLSRKVTPLKGLEHAPDVVLSELMRFVFIGRDSFNPICLARVQNIKVDEVLETNGLGYLKDRFKDPLAAAFPELALLNGCAS